MEVFNASQDLIKAPLPTAQSIESLQPKQVNKKKLIGFVTTGILVVSIFITTGLAGQVQKFFSRASMGPGSYGYGSFGSGRYSVLASTSPSPTASASPSITPSPSTGSPSPLPRKPGDVDGDNDVDIFDYNQIVSYFGRTDMTNPEVKKADLDQDNDVDIFDYNLVVSNFGL